MKSLTLRSPAKLNILLKIINKRPDGYHNLKTIFERIDLYDTLRLKSNASGKIRIRCSHPDVPTGPTNLVYKAAKLLQESCRVTAGVDINLTKRIPVAAGLGGGSSNAATTLIGLNRLWRLGLSRRQLAAYADRLGSDVTFFVYDCPWALGTGRGEKIRPLKLPAVLWHVLVVPQVKMHTPKVYGALNLKLTNNRDNVNILLHYLRKNAIHQIGSLLSNDLEVPIVTLCPNLLKIKEKLQTYDGQGVAFSGSGPSLFILVPSQRRGELLARRLKRRFRRVFLVTTAHA